MAVAGITSHHSEQPMAKKKAPLIPSTAARLDAWVRAFAKRPDIFVKVHKRGPAWKGAHNSIYEPKELDGFYTENNGYRLEWSAKKRGTIDEGGILNIGKKSGNHVLWYKDPGYHEVSPYLQAMMLDEQSSENCTMLLQRYVAGSRKKEHVVAGNNASSNQARFFESFAAYIQEGARKAFFWYWQWYETSETFSALLARSIAADTPVEAIVARLVDRGLSEAEAADLCAWLGSDVRVLLEAV